MKIFHFGGDEVSPQAWGSSPACDKLLAKRTDLSHPRASKTTILHRYFVRKVAAIAQEYGLDIAGWEDGLKYNKAPLPR